MVESSSRSDVSQSTALFIVGPTGVGKSFWAEELARLSSAVIFSCDSVQSYQGLDIGSAKPDRVTRKSLNYQMLDWVPVGKKITLGDFYREFFRRAENFLNQNWIVVGGTGFYFQALEKGLMPIPPASEEVQAKYWSKLREPGGDRLLFEQLQRLDPPVSRRLAMNDHYRLIRALEIAEVTGRPYEIEDEMKTRPSTFPRSIQKLGLRLPRPEYEQQLQIRVKSMLDAGWIQEVQNLMREVGEDWDPLRSVGYREIMEHLNGRIKSEDLVSAIVKSHLKLAKKQITWFQRDPQIHWLGSTGWGFHSVLGQSALS